MTPKYCTSVLEITSLFQKKENICQKEKQWHQNFKSELSGCNKIVIFFIAQKKLLKELDFMELWFWENISHIAL